MTRARAIAVDATVVKGGARHEQRGVIQEMPVAFVYDGGTEAVMMATPHDLEDFAVGFSLNERIITDLSQVTSLETVDIKRGVEIRMHLAPERREAVVGRRRMRAGPAGCGLCGIESLAEALPVLPTVYTSVRVSSGNLVTAMQSLEVLQVLNRETGAAHAAALWRPEQGVTEIREDVGRHNALDKLAGGLARTKQDSRGAVILITSRLSVELVQKAVMMGAEILAGISAPTSLAIEEAASAGLTLVGLVRRDGLVVYTHAERISDAA
jgi:FdhD protein